MNPSTFTAVWPYVLTLRSKWPLFRQWPQGSIPSLPHTGKEALSLMGSAEDLLDCFCSDCHYHCWDCPLSPGGPSYSHNRSTTCAFPWSLNIPLAIVLHALSYAWESSQVSYVHRLNSVSWHMVPSVRVFLPQFSYNPSCSLYPQRLLISQVTSMVFLEIFSVHQAAANTVFWNPIELKVLYHLHSLWAEKYCPSGPSSSQLWGTHIKVRARWPGDSPSAKTSFLGQAPLPASLFLYNTISLTSLYMTALCST